MWSCFRIKLTLLFVEFFLCSNLCYSLFGESLIIWVCSEELINEQCKHVASNRLFLVLLSFLFSEREKRKYSKNNQVFLWLQNISRRFQNDFFNFLQINFMRIFYKFHMSFFINFMSLSYFHVVKDMHFTQILCCFSKKKKEKLWKFF